MSSIDQLNRLISKSKAAWLLSLGACIPTALVAVQTVSSDFYISDTEFELPYFSTSVPTRFFFVFMPLLVFSCHFYSMYAHFRISRAISGVLAKGAILTEEIIPWIVSDTEVSRRMDEGNPTVSILLLFLTYFVAPLTIAICWWQSMPGRSPATTVFCFILFLASVYLSIRRDRFFGSIPRAKCNRGYMDLIATTVLVGLVTYLLLLSLERTRGIVRIFHDFRPLYVSPDGEYETDWEMVQNRRWYETIARWPDDFRVENSVVCKSISLTEDFSLEGFLPLCGLWGLAKIDLSNLSIIPTESKPADYSREYEASLRDWCSINDNKECADNVEFWEDWQETRSQALDELPIVNWSNLDLREVDLSGSNLSGVVFDGSLLSGARFINSTAEGTSFRHSDMRGAKFSDSSLQFADFDGANVSGSEFSNSRMEGTNLLSVLDDVEFIDTNLSHSRFAPPDGRINGASFVRSLFHFVELSFIRFEGSHFSGNSIKGWDVFSIGLTDTNFSCTEILQSRITGITVHNSTLSFVSDKDWCHGVYASKLTDTELQFDSITSSAVLGGVEDYYLLPASIKISAAWGSAFRNIDLSLIDVEPDLFYDNFGDGSVGIPADVTRPCHWHAGSYTQYWAFVRAWDAWSSNSEFGSLPAEITDFIGDLHLSEAYRQVC